MKVIKSFLRLIQWLLKRHLNYQTNIFYTSKYILKMSLFFILIVPTTLGSWATVRERRWYPLSHWIIWKTLSASPLDRAIHLPSLVGKPLQLNVFDYFVLDMILFWNFEFLFICVEKLEIDGRDSIPKAIKGARIDYRQCC